MATFTPTTYGIGISTQPRTGRYAQHKPMWRHYGAPIKVGYSVLITSGTATASPGRVSPSVDDINNADAGSGEGGQAWFRGGITYTVTAAEKVILVAAGYTVT